MIVYLRDTADFRLISDYFDRHHPSVPRAIVLAPVCRPGWLVEVECMAIVATEENRFEIF
jgi:enamine deaminase RidA (YjgF/YER057c/UK114 family)